MPTPGGQGQALIGAVTGIPLLALLVFGASPAEAQKHKSKTRRNSTEVAAAKLYAALELGESLTSMYMRINDTVFDPETEHDLESADLVDDPLVRCLFNDAFGAYQAAQLRRADRAGAVCQRRAREIQRRQGARQRGRQFRGAGRGQGFGGDDVDRRLRFGHGAVTDARTGDDDGIECAGFFVS